MLESLAESVMDVLDNEIHDENLIRFPCIRILNEYYDTDRDKYNTVVRIIQERRKNDRRNRKQSASRRNDK